MQIYPRSDSIASGLMGIDFVPSLGASERRAGLMAELALASGSVKEFRQLCIEQLRNWLDTDQVSIQTATDAGRVDDIALLGYEGVATVEHLIPLWMDELTPSEVGRLCSAHLSRCSDIFSATRLQRLRIYADVMRPLGIKDSATTIWRSPCGASALSISRAGELRTSELHALQHLLPSIRVADGYLQLNRRWQTDNASGSFEAWVDHVGLSARETEVAALAVRGLQNREIAQLLRVSVHTARNQLSNVFRKAGVTTRAELAFVSKELTRSPDKPQPEWLRCLNHHLRPTG